MKGLWLKAKYRIKGLLNLIKGFYLWSGNSFNQYIQNILSIHSEI